MLTVVAKTQRREVIVGLAAMLLLRIPVGAIVAPMAATALTVLAGITAGVFFRPRDATTNP